jgi:hypothetical protein
MGNHYHLLIETKHDNLSLIAREITSTFGGVGEWEDYNSSFPPLS